MRLLLRGVAPVLRRPGPLFIRPLVISQAPPSWPPSKSLVHPSAPASHPTRIGCTRRDRARVCFEQTTQRACLARPGRLNADAAMLRQATEFTGQPHEAANTIRRDPTAGSWTYSDDNYLEVPTLGRSCETDFTSCANANGFCKKILLGTPFKRQSCAEALVAYITASDGSISLASRATSHPLPPSLRMMSITSAEYFTTPLLSRATASSAEATVRTSKPPSLSDLWILTCKSSSSSTTMTTASSKRHLRFALLQTNPEAVEMFTGVIWESDEGGT
jgi:hypothetical protein